MKKYNVQTLLIIGSIVLLIAALIVGFLVSDGGSEGVAAGAMKKDSAIVNDGYYVYYTSPEGHVMCVDPYDTTPYVWVKNRSVLAVNETHILLSSEDAIEVFFKEEKGVVESYNVKTQNAYITDEYIYYIAEDTGYIMTINRMTKEESVLIPQEVKMFDVYGTQLMYVPQGKKTGIVAYDMSGKSAMLYAQDKTIADFAVEDDNCLYYSDAGKKNQISKISYNWNKESVIKGKKASNFCFCRGAFFFAEKAKGGVYNLMIDNREAY